jgi:hypothetical protein
MPSMLEVHSRCLASWLGAAWLVLVVLVPLASLACGGATPEAKAPEAQSAPSASSSATAAPNASEPSVNASTVRFDDLGIAFTVPPGYRVLGDEELAARVRANADLRLNRSLREQAKQKKSLPLLTLDKQVSDASDFVNVSLVVALVPGDATASEVLAQQQALMKDHLASFEVVEAPKPRAIGSTKGMELVSRAMMKRGGEAKRVASIVRVFVRDGMAITVTAVWPDGAGARGEEARLMLENLQFYDAPKSGT